MSDLANTPLWTVGWGFSARCDLHCPFCYSSRVRLRTTHPEVGLAVAEQFLARNGPAIRSINFGTGESFLAPDFPQLLELCHRHASQARIAITTNGALADLAPLALMTVARTLHECDLSLDFAQAEAHDRWRGKAGTWDRALRALELSREMGLQTSIVMLGAPQTLTAGNLRGMARLAEAHQVALRINLYMPTSGDMTFLPPSKTIFELLLFLQEWSAAVRSSDRLLSHLMGQSLADSHLARRFSCRILPNGKASPSTYLLEPPWTVAATLDALDLAALPETTPFVRYAAPPLPDACRDCPEQTRCRGGSVERRWLWPMPIPLAPIRSGSIKSGSIKSGSIESGADALLNPDPLCPRLNPVAAVDLPRLASTPAPDWSGPTVHLDYLPTIVALPPEAG